MPAPSQRIDLALVHRGLFDSRSRAQAAIAAGLVFADGVKIDKTSARVAADVVLTAEPAHPFVSRGGVKLAAALAHFNVAVAGRLCLDVGASTGGFTDVLLRAGAAHVFALDIGHGQFHPSLKQDRVTLLEGTDARSLAPATLGAAPQVIVCDVSFISLTLVLPAISAVAAAKADLVALVKPQFEAGRGHRKKGIVRDPAVHADVCRRIESRVAAQGWRVRATIDSPLLGGDGNREFLLGAARG
jgi:23S rRNA (cytidine1920-2'-O)/16S rRNA (cytidine1409-2'-O)-methyltransferase